MSAFGGKADIAKPIQKTPFKPAPKKRGKSKPRVASIRPSAMAKKAAIYVRVSTDKQTVENQLSELRRIAERRGWEVVEEYRDAGISGVKGRSTL